jgi:hypothetical protein
MGLARVTHSTLTVAPQALQHVGEGRTDWSFVGCLQGECGYDARLADSALKCCEASEEGVLGGTFRGSSEFALTHWEI